jgi:hypothetical protein
MASNTFLFLPIGALLAPPQGSPKRVRALVQAVWVALTLAAGYEVGRLFLPRHSPGITNMLIESFGAWLGFVVACRAWDNLRMNTLAPSGGNGSQPNSQRACWQQIPTGLEGQV